MSVEVQYTAQLNVIETLEENVPAALAANRRVTHNQFNTAATLNAGTTPPVTKCAHFTMEEGGGNHEINLSELIGTNGAYVDGTGLKPQAIRFKAPADNVGQVRIIAEDDSGNGYGLLGYGTYTGTRFILAAGDEITILCPGTQPDIASDARIIYVEFMNGGGKLHVALVLG